MTPMVGEIYLASESWPYIILILCVLFITCVCVLKFSTYFWYHQPLTFRWTMSRFFGGGGGQNTRVMNSLVSSGTRCYNAVVYPFLHFVNHDCVRVYSDGDGDAIPYERIAAFLSRPETEIVTAGRRVCIASDTLEYILSKESHGLSVFIGVLGTECGRSRDTTSSTSVIKGVCVLTPRIMLSFGSGGGGSSVSIYVCDHLAWLRYTTRERDSLELLETTEYIQKSREIAGEQTLYRYNEIPWFVVPFTTVYTYTFTAAAAATTTATPGTTIVPVSSTNFALFYAFVNQRARDFRCCILYELSQLQSLVQGGIYRIFMLVLNQVRVLAVYIFAPSILKVSQTDALRRHRERFYTDSVSRKSKPKRTRGNRISELHDYIAETSTALVKYLPPVEKPKYDMFGRRVKARGGAATTGATGDDDRQKNNHERSDMVDVALLISSIREKSLCDNETFVRGLHMSLTTLHPSFVCIDTIAHNYLLIDAMLAAGSATLVSREKWYYIMYNAIIERETLCKDIFTA